jgi:nucleotide-binding universal stress UspA family protein
MKGKDFIKVGEPTVTRSENTIVVEDKEKVDRLKSLALREMQLRNAYIEMAVLVFDMLVEIVDEGDVNVFEHALKAKRERMKIMGELQKELEELGINASEKEFELNFEENRVVIKIAENNEG